MFNTLTEKYRPTCLDECILPERIKKPLEKLVKRGQLGHLIFYGKPGNGKTSTAMALIKELKSENFVEINGSLDNSVDFIKQSMPQWGAGLYNGRRIIFFDEADNLTENAQKILKVPLEKYAGIFDIIFCVNDFDKIDNAIKSRCTSFFFDIKEDEEDKIKKLVVKRFLSISKKEKISIKKSDIEDIYFENNGDIRAMLKKLELF
jgi:replication factor C small subunit